MQGKDYSDCTDVESDTLGKVGNCTVTKLEVAEMKQEGPAAPPPRLPPQNALLLFTHNKTTKLMSPSPDTAQNREAVAQNE